MQSVAAQTYENLEIIVIDGQSQDNTLDIVRKYENKIKWISEPDEGIYDAMNKGIDMATGTWLYFLGSDDTLYAPDVFTRISSRVDLRNYDVVYCDVKFQLSGQIYDGPFTNQKLMHVNICHQAMLVRKQVYLEVGKFFTRYKLLADWIFNLVWFPQKRYRRKYLNIVVANYHEGGSSVQSVDGLFHRDKVNYIKTYFPWYDRIRYMW